MVRKRGKTSICLNWFQNEKVQLEKCIETFCFFIFLFEIFLLIDLALNSAAGN